MPFIHCHRLQVTKCIRVTFLCQQQVQAFRGDDHHLRHISLLTLTLAGGSIPVPYTHTPGHPHFRNDLLHRPSNVLGQRAERRHPKQSQTVLPAGLPVDRMGIDEPDDGSQEYSIGLPATRRRINDPAALRHHFLPGLRLKRKRMPVSSTQPPVHLLPTRALFHVNLIQCFWLYVKKIVY